MKKATILTLLFLAAASLVKGSDEEPKFVAGEVIVKFRPEASGYRSAAISALGLQEVRSLGEKAPVLVATRSGQSVEAAVRELESRGDVEYAQPNYIYRALRTVPSDPSFGNQRHLELIRAPLAWDIDTGLASETIAIVDSGADTDHVDIDTRFVFFDAIDVIGNDSDPQDDDCSGHGLAVAGAAGALTNNDTLVSGVDWNAPLLPIRVLSGCGASGTSLTVDSGIRAAAKNNARVINLSLGFSSSAVDNLVEAAITVARDSGAVVLAAAGNDGAVNVIYPASSTRTIAIGSSSNSDARSSFSNFGAATGLNGVDLVAPGENILTLGMSNVTRTISGTSLSTPIVSGAAALVRAHRPGLSAENVLRFMRATAQDIGNEGYDSQTGAGRLDLYRLITVATGNPAYAGANFLAPDTRTSEITSGGRQAHQSLPITTTDSYAGYRNRVTAGTGTIRVYFKPDSGQPTSDTAFILTQRGNLTRQGGNIDVILRADSKIEYRLADSGTLVSVTKLNPGQWYHIAVTYGSRGMTLFVNGDSEANNSVTGGPPTADTVFLGAPISMNGAQSARGRFDAINFAETQLMHFPSALFARVESLATATTISRGLVDVGWKSYATETNSITIDVYADTDNEGFNGILLSSGQTNDEHQEDISIGGLVLSQSYYILIKATDASTALNQFPEIAWAYSASPFTNSTPPIVTVSGPAGSGKGPCLLVRSGWNVSSMRTLRDLLLATAVGRLFCNFYYIIFA